MKCPNCGFEQPESAEACEACGLIFAKWRERHPAPAPEAAAQPESAAPQESSPPPKAVVPLDALLDPPKVTSAENPVPKPDTPPTPPSPEQAAPASKSSPLLERQYIDFSVKKFAWISGILLLGLGVYVFTTSKPAEKTGYGLPRPVNPLETVYPTETPWATTPTPTAIPMTITGPPWALHGKVVDCLHLTPIGAVTFVFSNNGVAVTTTTDAQGLYQISVPQLSGTEAWEVQFKNEYFREGFWLDDSSTLSEQQRLGRYYEYQEDNKISGLNVGGGDKHIDFSLYPARLTEQENMWLQNARPKEQ